MRTEPVSSLLLEEESSYRNYDGIHYDSKGIICISQIEEGKWQNRYGRYQAMRNYMVNLDHHNDLFFSQNTFKKFKRKTEYLLELKALYIDLDFHKSTHFTKKQALGYIDLLVAERKIPEPTYILNSGYGLNLIWRIKRTPAQALPLWRTIQEYFYQEFELYGADRKALDVTRVFRVDGSYNAKYAQKNKVSVIHYNPIEYDIHFIQEYIRFPKAKKKKNLNQSKTIVRLFNRYSLYYSRYQDLLAICKLRNYEMTGVREQVLFLYRYYGCAYLADDSLALENALELNSRFTQPLSEAEVIRATRSAERAAKTLKYGYRNQTLINLLCITEQEMAQKYKDGNYILTSIISTEEKYRRNNERRFNKRRNEEGLTKEDQRQLTMLDQVAQLRAEGKKQAEVAKLLGVTIRTIQKYEKKIREEVK